MSHASAQIFPFLSLDNGRWPRSFVMSPILPVMGPAEILLGCSKQLSLVKEQLLDMENQTMIRLSERDNG